MANWERKSSYLLREIVKFQTYIDCLQAAQAQKEKIYAARAAAAEFDGDKEKGKAAGQEEKCTTTTTTSTTFGGSTT